jgi:hypothetical protein
VGLAVSLSAINGDVMMKASWACMIISEADITSGDTTVCMVVSEYG